MYRGDHAAATQIANHRVKKRFKHANAYSPLWDAQVGEWTQKAIDEGLNVRMTDENRILNLVAERPDLLTGPGGSPYASVGFVINCPTVGSSRTRCPRKRRRTRARWRVLRAIKDAP